MRGDARLVIVGREFPGVLIQAARVVQAMFEFRLGACEAQSDHGVVEVHVTLMACAA